MDEAPLSNGGFLQAAHRSGHKSGADDNPFTIPEQLVELNNGQQLDTIGEPGGLQCGLRTDLEAGLSLDETTFDASEAAYAANTQSSQPDSRHWTFNWRNPVQSFANRILRLIPSEPIPNFCRNNTESDEHPEGICCHRNCLFTWPSARLAFWIMTASGISCIPVGMVVPEYGKAIWGLVA
jgi:hypothetical protein